MLIQIGGMGVVTAAAAISMLAGRRIGLKERWVMQESISAPQVGGIVRMTGFILMTFFVSTFRIIRMMNGNLEAFVLVGEKVMEIAEDARAELAAQAREEQACREDEGN